MDRKELGARQEVLLRQLLEYAAENSPFHRARFAQAGFRPADLRSVQDLKRLPTLSKDDLRSESERILCRGYDASNTMHKRTGGSTGVPVHVRMDYQAASIKRAAVERHDGWAGWRPGVRCAAVWGDTDKPQSWKSRLRNALSTRTTYLDTLCFTEEKLAAFVRVLRTERPPMLFGHAHSVFRLAEYVARTNGPPIAFRGIITTAMTLSPEERMRIEEVFATPVFNRYGCEEISIIASECEAHAGMHVFAEGVLLEYGTGARPGEPAKLLVTDLLNRAMPLIRYEIGDLAIPEDCPCPCGRGLPLLREVSGREADFLYTPEGKPVFGISILDTFVIHIAGIKQLQIVQDRLDHLRIRVVRDREFSDDTTAKLGNTIRKVFGEVMTWNAEYVPAIELTPAGKYRFSICELATTPAGQALREETRGA